MSKQSALRSPYYPEQTKTVVAPILQKKKLKKSTSRQKNAKKHH